MTFIWDDRKKKGFGEEDKWVDYKYCVDEGFISKNEMNDARKRGFKKRTGYIIAKYNRNSEKAQPSLSRARKVISRMSKRFLHIIQR